MTGTLGDGLTFLAADAFTEVADTFALIGLGRVERADARGDSAHELLIDALHLDLRLIGDGDFDAVRNREDNLVRVAEREIEGLALERGFETDALDLEITREAFANAFDHSGDHRASRAVHGAGEGGIADGRDIDFGGFDFDRNDVSECFG